MARVTINTTSAVHVQIHDIDDDTATLVERLTVDFGKRGGTWVAGLDPSPGPPIRRPAAELDPLRF